MGKGGREGEVKLFVVWIQLQKKVASLFSLLSFFLFLVLPFLSAQDSIFVYEPSINRKPRRKKEREQVRERLRLSYRNAQKRSKARKEEHK